MNNMRLMKLKEFNESFNSDEPTVGEYVVIEINTKAKLYDYICSHVGKLNRIENYKNIQDIYYIEFENVPKDLRKWFSESIYKGIYTYIHSVGRKSITNWSENKEYLEMILKSKKFNI